MRRLVLAAAFAALVPAAAHAAPTKLDFAPTTKDSRERTFVEAVTGGKLDGVLSVVTDLDGDGSAEIGVKTGCADADALCRTRIFSHRGEKWAVIFDQTTAEIYADKLATGPIPAMTPLTSSAAAYKWNGSRYVVDAARSGKSADFQKAPESYRGSLAMQFGEGAYLLEREHEDLGVDIAMLAPDGKENLLLVKLSGEGTCGMTYGCPIRLLRVKDGRYQALLEGMTGGDVILSRTKRSGMADIVVTRPDGRSEIYGWTGDRYVAAGS